MSSFRHCARIMIRLVMNTFSQLSAQGIMHLSMLCATYPKWGQVTVGDLVESWYQDSSPMDGDFVPPPYFV